MREKGCDTSNIERKRGNMLNIVITGASKGIGAEILSKFKSHQLFAISRTEIKDDGVEWIQADLTKQEEIKKVCYYLKQIDVDVLINNAGGGEVKDLCDVTQDLLTNEFTLNLYAPIFLTQTVLAKMMNKNFGRIINIASISGNKGTPYLFTYSAAKAALINFTESCAQYVSGKDITVNSISPGGFNTVMSINGRKKLSKMYNMEKGDYQNEMLSQMGRKKLIEPQEITKVIELLINCEGINGQNIKISGLI